MDIITFIRNLSKAFGTERECILWVRKIRNRRVNDRSMELGLRTYGAKQNMLFVVAILGVRGNLKQISVAFTIYIRT